MSKIQIPYRWCGQKLDTYPDRFLFAKKEKILQKYIFYISSGHLLIFFVLNHPTLALSSRKDSGLCWKRAFDLFFSSIKKAGLSGRISGASLT